LHEGLPQHAIKCSAVNQVEADIDGQAATVSQAIANQLRGGDMHIDFDMVGVSTFASTYDSIAGLGMTIQVPPNQSSLLLLGHGRPACVPWPCPSAYIAVALFHFIDHVAPSRQQIEQQHVLAVPSCC
jgi:hypothetical protein